MDSLMVLGMLKGTLCCCPEPKPMLLQELINLADWEVRASHCFWDTNQVADKCAEVSQRIWGFIFIILLHRRF